MLSNDRAPWALVSSDDTRNHLPLEARRRIGDCYLKQQSIRELALAAIHARGGIAWEQDGNCRAEWSRAKMQAALEVLSQYVVELLAIGKTDNALEDMIRDELEGAANSLELSSMEREAVWSSLLTVRSAPPPKESSSPRESAPIAEHRIHREMIRRIAASKKIVAETWAKDNGIGRSSMYAYFKNGKASQETIERIKSAIEKDCRELGLSSD